MKLASPLAALFGLSVGLSVGLAGLSLDGLAKLHAADAPSGDAVDYTRQVRPILASRCYRCHSSLKQEGALRLDQTELLLKGGEGGPAVVPGKSAESRLIQAVVGAGDLKMPPEGQKLTDEQIEILKRWIDQGAKMPAADEPIRHWSFVAPKKPAIPASPAGSPAAPDARAAAGPRTALDSFIDASLAAQKLVPTVAAPKHLLLRRVYLDLVGLPPSPEALREFLADDAPDAYERIVDRLLASPQHGERWGRHWMDVWRYSDWDGYGAEVRESQPHIWRWRDWIVESVNADKPYNRMIVEMLAGDEVAPDDPQTVRATGFLVRNWYKFNRNVWLDNTIEHTGKAFLGLTFNCSRCHDHMYDPIQHREYYSLRAIFEPYDIRTDRIPGQADPAKDGLVRAYDAKLDAPTHIFTRGDEKQVEKDQLMTAGLPKVLQSVGEFKAGAIGLPPASYYPGSRDYVHNESLEAARAEVTKAEASAAAAQKAYQEQKAKTPPPAVAATGTPANGASATPDAAAKTEKPAAPATPAPAAQKPAEPLAPSMPVFSDDFAAAKPDLWTSIVGKFEHKDGSLFQTEPLNGEAGMTSTKSHPRDFSAKLKFKITGGSQWKSTGLSWDVVGDNDANVVYVSAYADGPKIQLAWKRDGKLDYPTDLAKPLPIELNRSYELQVVVRDAVVNVLLDGQLQLAARQPSRVESGKVRLWTYDATAQFQSLQVSTFGKDTPLVDVPGAATTPATGSPAAPPPPVDALKLAELAATAADKALAAAKLNVEAVTARIAADRATYALTSLGAASAANSPASSTPSPEAKQFALAAGAVERRSALAQAEHKLADAEHKLALAQQALKPEDAKLKKAYDDAVKAVEAQKKARDAAQAAVAQPNENYTRFTPIYATTSTGRRLGLANWIASDANPLTPRVAINHIWLRHFGTPLVPTVFEFGANGKPPSHPDLIDWLSRDLVDGGWSTKRVHREIVTSTAYRRASHGRGPDDPNRTLDPENKFLWRMNSRRMEAEAVRDATLAVADGLDLRMAGPDLDPAAGLTLGRRSIYFRNSKEKKMTFLSLFDSPNVTECYKRSESIAPQQALAMVNSGLTLAQARTLAKSLTTAAGGANEPERVAAFVRAAFERILCREATTTELAECQKFVAEQTQRFTDMKSLTAFAGGSDASVKPSADPHQRARENLVHVLLNHNDFVTIR